MNRLYCNEQGLFTEQALLVGLADTGDGRGLGLADYDNDGDIDVFVGNRTGGSRIYRNDGGRFEEANQEVGLEVVVGEVGPVFGDYDGDGDLDLFIASETGLNQLHRNDGGSFRQIAHQDTFYLGEQTVGTAFADYDNDGDLDLLASALTNRFGGDELYQNRDNYLVPIGPLIGLAKESQGRGLSFADFDGDGDQDLLVADIKRSRLYRNISGEGHWLQVELEGPEHNRHALGARVELRTGERRLLREVQSVYGYCSQVQPRLHFGLGELEQVDSLWVMWPDGSEGLQLDVSADQHLKLRREDLITAVLDEDLAVPTVFALQPNYPNPFNAQTIIAYQLPYRTPVALTVYNIAGQVVKHLVNEVQEAGPYQVAWKGRDEKGRVVGSGVYLYRFEADGFERTRRLVLLK